MNDRSPFNPLQAQEVGQAFGAAGVDYLFIGNALDLKFEMFIIPITDVYALLKHLKARTLA